MAAPQPTTTLPLLTDQGAGLRLPPTVRHAAYWTFALAGAVLVVCQIVGVDTGKAAEVLAYLGVLVGSVAGANVLQSPDA